MILAGDIGGTKANLALFSDDLNAPAGRKNDRCAEPWLALARYRSQDFNGLGAIIEKFLQDLGDQRPSAICAACFGIAGPVFGNRTETTNLPWVVDGGELGHRFSIASLSLLNDLVATAEGISALRDDEFAVLNEGTIEPPVKSEASRAVGSWNRYGHGPIDAGRRSLGAFWFRRWPHRLRAERRASDRIAPLSHASLQRTRQRRAGDFWPGPACDL